MSRLAEFRKLEQQLAAQLAELESLKNDSGLQREIEFETKLRDLLGTASACVTWSTSWIRKVGKTGKALRLPLKSRLGGRAR
jgi:hypothetical protein